MQEEMWQAIVQCDGSYEGRFFYGVVTTGIFCRPSCKSRVPKRENVRIFPSVDEALAANFRPCKRCLPHFSQEPVRELAEQAMNVIRARYNETLTLQKLANELHVSASHLHRTFSRIFGYTPNECLKETRLQVAEHLLVHTKKRITDIGVAVGISNPSHFATVFQKKYGMSPSTYRAFHQHTTVEERV